MVGRCGLLVSARIRVGKLSFGVVSLHA